MCVCLAVLPRLRLALLALCTRAAATRRAWPFSRVSAAAFAMKRMPDSDDGGCASAAPPADDLGQEATSTHKRVLLKPQTFIRLVEDQHLGGGKRQYLHNQSILEVVALPGADWESEVDADSGLCMLFDGQGDGSWAVDRLRLHLFTRQSSGEHFLYRDDDLVGKVGALRSRHDVVQVPLVREPDGSTILVQCAMFAFDQNGGRLLVSTADLWKKMCWDFAPRSGAQWFQNKQQRWARLASVFGLGPSSVRASLPFAKLKDGNGELDNDRCLCFSSIHISLLLLQCITAARSTSKRFGQVAFKKARAGFERILLSLLDFVKPGHKFELRLAEPVVRLGSVPAGGAPVSLQLQEGEIISAAGFQDQGWPWEVRRDVLTNKLENLAGALGRGGPHRPRNGAGNRA